VTNNFDEERFDLSELKKNPYNYENFLFHWVIFGNPLDNINIDERYKILKIKAFLNVQ